MFGVQSYLDSKLDKYKTAELKARQKQVFIDKQKELEKNRPESPQRKKNEKIALEKTPTSKMEVKTRKIFDPVTK
jgi:hypothetical protein